jgi:hypothetical protein
VSPLVEAFVLGNNAILTDLSMSIATSGWPDALVVFGSGRGIGEILTRAGSSR